MAQNITIAGASYPDVPSINVPTTSGGTATFVDTSDANAVASKIASGYTCYVNATKVSGSLVAQASKTITPTSSEQTAVLSGRYTTGAVKVAAVPTETKTVNENGTVTPSSGKFLSSVTVSIPTYDGSVT